MTRDSSTSGLPRLQRTHRLRRIVAWVSVVVLGLTLTSLAFGVMHGSSAQRRALVSGGEYTLDGLIDGQRETLVGSPCRLAGGSWRVMT